jgi:hypothetical protein
LLAAVWNWVTAAQSAVRVGEPVVTPVVTDDAGDEGFEGEGVEQPTIPMSATNATVANPSDARRSVVLMLCSLPAARNRLTVFITALMTVSSAGIRIPRGR